MKLIRGIAGIVVALVLLSGCSALSGANHASLDSLKLPSGWEASEDKDGKISIKGPDKIVASIWPMFINGTVDKTSAPAILDDLLKRNNSDIVWDPSKADSEKAETLGGDDTLRGVAILSYKNSAKVTTAVFYETQGSKTALDTNETQLLKILSNYRTLGSSYSPPASAKIDYKTFKEPEENAFALEYPADWTAEGKVVRVAGGVPILAFQAMSKSKNSTVVFNDPNFSMFVEPYCLPYIGCFKDGTADPRGNQILAYMGGLQFAKYYIQLKTKNDGCTDLSFGAQADYSSKLANLSNESASWGVPMQFNAGEISFSCKLGEKVVQGVSGAITTKFDNGFGMKNWAVMRMSYVASLDQEGDHMGDVYSHMLSTYKISSSWQSQQTSTALADSKINAAASDAIFNTISEGYWSRQATMDAISERRSDATLGLTNTVDSITGEARKVESGSNYYWADDKGNIVGTDTSATPGIDFHNLALKN